METYRQENNNTKQKEMEGKLRKLTDFEFWIYQLGYTQILNIVCEASLEAQHSSYFATSSLYLVFKAVEKLRDLANFWDWEEEDLIFAGIGSPQKHLENLRNGFFKPYVSLKGKQKRAAKINSLTE